MYIFVGCLQSNFNKHAIYWKQIFIVLKETILWMIPNTLKKYQIRKGLIQQINDKMTKYLQGNIHKPLTQQQFIQ